VSSSHKTGFYLISQPLVFFSSIGTYCMIHLFSWNIQKSLVAIPTVEGHQVNNLTINSIGHIELKKEKRITNRVAQFTLMLKPKLAVCTTRR